MGQYVDGKWQPDAAEMASGEFGGADFTRPTRATVKAANDAMLIRAMKKAVELGVFPKHVDEATYLRNWSALKEILEEAQGHLAED